MNETKEKTVPVRKTSPGPAGLDGVLIDSCAFTESVSKKEPRPPLYHGGTSTAFGGVESVGGNVLLEIPGNRSVYVLVVNPEGMLWGRPRRNYPGLVIPQGRFDGEPEYTGPITPAMWAIIRKWWQP